MYIKKFIQATIDLFEARQIYHPDREQMIRDELHRRYVGKCFAACYITEILELVRYSETRMTSDRLDGSASIDVQFCARCIVFAVGEVFCGSRVSHVRLLDIITASDNVVSRIIRNDRRNIDKTIKQGQLIPLTVESVSYSVGRDKMSVAAHPTVPADFVPRVLYCYEINDTLSAADKEKIEFFYSEITELMARISAAPKEMLELFTEFLYPYAAPQDLKKIYKEFGELKPLNLLKDKEKILNLRSGSHVMTPPQIIKMELNIYSVAAPDKNSAQVKVHSTGAYVALAALFSEYLVYLNAMAALLAEYDSRAKLSENKYYFAAYREAKLSVVSDN